LDILSVVLYIFWVPDDIVGTNQPMSRKFVVIVK
jgi:hypothetical protein